MQQNQHKSQIYSSSNHTSAHSSVAADIYKHKVPLPINNLNLGSGIQPNSIFNYEDEPLENESSDDEIFLSLNLHDTNKQSFEKNGHNSQLAASTTQLNLENKVSTAKNGLFFQDETHLIQWLETHRDIVLQALNAICSLPSQVSYNLFTLIIYKLL